MCNTRLMLKKEKPTQAVKVEPKTIKKPKKKPVTSLFFKFTGDDGVEYSLTKRQKLFVEYYLTFGANGVDAVIEAGYDVDYKDKNGNSNGTPNRKMASVIATQNLSKLNICAYITTKLEEYGFNDKNVEKQHLFLINQNADLTNKKSALDMFYKLKGKYAPEEHKVQHELTQEQLDRIIKG